MLIKNDFIKHKAFINRAHAFYNIMQNHLRTSTSTKLDVQKSQQLKTGCFWQNLLDIILRCMIT